MSFGKVQLTNAGRSLLTQAISGQKLNFTKMQMGSGKLTTQAITDISALIEPVKNVDITSISVQAEYASISGQFTNQGLEQGFWWREIGLFASIGTDGQAVLFAYANAYDLAEYISAAGSEIIEKTLRMPVFISSAKEITAVINSSLIYVSMEDFQSHVSDDIHHLPSGGETGQVPIKTESGIEWKVMELPPSFDNLLAWPGCKRITPPKDEASGSYTETIVNKATNALRAKRVTVQNGESDYTETYFFYEEDGETLQAKYVVHTTKDTTETWTEDVTKEGME